ncbi:hypothetical protein HY732_03335 [Candidatus Uhrbacteria bacterium]|nr:hypothetical protein [Candidatus Uhrbacteria bacterium]
MNKIFLLTVLALAFFPNANATPCTSEDKDYAKSWDNYYAPDEAYEYGLSIQNLVREKNTEGLFSLLEGELSNGPRRKFALSTPFDELFNKEWVKKVLEEDPPCSPVGWRGFMLGNGMIWFGKYDGEWTIVSINGAAEEKVEKPPPIGWRVKGKIIHPQCFSYGEWAEGHYMDIYGEIAKKFHIADHDDFKINTGMYIGREIKSFSPATPSLCLNDNCRDDTMPGKLTLIHFTKRCSNSRQGQAVRERAVWNRIDGVEYEYELLRYYSVDACQKLAPSINAKCIESFFVRVGADGGGTMGPDWHYGIYGLFDLPKYGLGIVPLKFFPNKNHGLNFLSGD